MKIFIHSRKVEEKYFCITVWKNNFKKFLLKILELFQLISKTRIEQKCYSHNCYIWKSVGHTFFMRFDKYRVLHERSMIFDFSFMQIVWLAFSHKPKTVDFLIFIFSKILGCIPDRGQVTKSMVYSKLESPNDWSSGIYNALEMAWIP